MHIESAYPQDLVPRPPQHLVRRQTIQSVVHPATDQCADQAADQTAHRGGHRYSCLRRLVSAVRVDDTARSGARTGTACACTGTRSCPCAGSRVRGWFAGVVSVWHVNPAPRFAIKRCFHTRKQHPTARADCVCDPAAPGCMLRE
jgi:hypothetical protein